jgi:hypothetical protein
LEKSGRAGIKAMAGAVAMLLILQFVLGMYINLFVSIPQNMHWGMMMYSAGRMMHAFPGFVPLMLHIFLSIAITALSITGFVLSSLFGSIQDIVLNVIGFASIIIAGASGLAFMMGGQNNINSYIMAVGFLVALVTYMVEFAYANTG